MWTKIDDAQIDKLRRDRARARTSRRTLQRLTRTPFAGRAANRRRGRHVAGFARAEALTAAAAYAFKSEPGGDPYLVLFLAGPDGASIDSRDAVYVHLSREQARTVKADLGQVLS